MTTLAAGSLARNTPADASAAPGKPAILGGTPAVTLDQKAANVWPIITADDEAAVLRVLRTGELSSGHLPSAMGGYPCPHPEVLALECEFAKYMGLPVFDVGEMIPAFAGKGFHVAPNVLAHNNGTAAILGGLHALDIGPGDEVIVPSTTWWSSVLTILHVGGIPVFAETDLDTLALDPAEVEAKITKRTKAVIVTHLFGIPAKMTEMVDVCKSNGLKLMEDASHAHGATYKGTKLGLLGDVAAFSLQVNKLIPSAEGGLLIAQDPEVILKAARYAHYERLVPLKAIDHPYAKFAATGFGFKFRMSPISAAIARVQLAKLAERNALRNASCIALSKRIETASRGAIYTYLSPGNGTERVYFEFLVRYDASKAHNVPIKVITKALAAEGCQVSAPRYPLLHQQPVFVEGEWAKLARLEGMAGVTLPTYDPASLPRTTANNGTLIKLPSFPQASPELIEQYAVAFEKVFANLDSLPTA